MNNFKRNENVRVRKFQNEFYLLGNGNSYSLNYLGAVVIKYLGKNITLAKLVVKISKHFPEVAQKKIKQDVIDFIDFLLSEELVSIDNNEQ